MFARTRVPFWNARNIVEHDGRVGHLVHMDIDDGADFLMMIRAADMLKLSVGFELFDPVA